MTSAGTFHGVPSLQPRILGKLAQVGRGWHPSLAWSREEGKISPCLFQVQNGRKKKKSVEIRSLNVTCEFAFMEPICCGTCLPLCLTFVSWELGLATVKLGSPQNVVRQKCGLYSRYKYRPVARSQENCLSSGYIWAWLWTVGGLYFLDPLWGWLLCLHGFLIVSGIFTVCPAETWQSIWKKIFF